MAECLALQISDREAPGSNAAGYHLKCDERDVKSHF